MDRNQIDRSTGARLRSRLHPHVNASFRVRGEWSDRSDPQSRTVNPSLRGADFRRFARAIERDLDPQGPLERIVTRQATRAAWALEHSLGAELATNAYDRFETSSAARTLKISITTLDLLQGRRVGTGTSVPANDHPSPLVEPDDAEAEFSSNEWPTLPETVEAKSAPEIEAEPTEAEDIPIWRGRLVYDFDISDESPVVRGTWITVSHVVTLIVDGATWADILRSHPELTSDDIRACVAYAVAEDDAGL